MGIIMTWIFCSLFVLIQNALSTLGDNSNMPGSDTCTGPTAEIKPLELVFLIDRSSTYVLGEMPRVIDIMDSLLVSYPGSKFGITSFSDYACSVFNMPNVCTGLMSQEEPENGVTPEYHKDPAGCYMFITALTTDAQSIKMIVKQQTNLEYLPSGDRESGFAGLYLSAAELKMKWTRGTSGAVKIIMVITDDETHVGKIKAHLNFTEKIELKGDGTDQCVTMHNPDSAQVGKLLGRDDMGVFVLYQTTTKGSGQNADKSWDNALKDSKRPYKLVKLMENNEKIVEELNKFIKDKWGEKVETFACRDPPMYNTLGL